MSYTDHQPVRNVNSRQKTQSSRVINYGANVGKYSHNHSLSTSVANKLVRSSLQKDQFLQKSAQKSSAKLLPEPKKFESPVKTTSIACTYNK